MIPLIALVRLVGLFSNLNRSRVRCQLDRDQLFQTILVRLFWCGARLPFSYMPKRTKLRERMHQVTKQTLQMSLVWKHH